MKKFLASSFFVVLVSLLVITPIKALAADDVYYDLGDDSRLYIGALVCKVANCLLEGEASDWYNYSTTSENVAGNGGLGQTLVVSPGDTLYFYGVTEVTGQASINPVYGIEFTNSSYMTIHDLFGNVVEGVDYSDIDDDGTNFEYYDINNILLSAALSDAADEQIGAISATVDADTPDGTLITGIFYLVDPDQERIGFGPQRAMAADDDLYLRSEVRMLVSVPSETPAETVAPPAALPATGAESQTKINYLFLLGSVIIIAGTGYFLKRVRS